MVPKDFRGWEGRDRTIDQRVWWGRQGLWTSLYPSRSLMTFSYCYFCTLECCTTIPTLLDTYDMQACLRGWYYGRWLAVLNWAILVVARGICAI